MSVSTRTRGFTVPAAMVKGATSDRTRHARTIIRVFMVFPSAQALSAGAVAVERDGQNGDEPFDHLLPERRDIEQRQSVVQHTDEQAAEHGSGDGAATARQRCAADDDRGNRIELI